MDLRLLLTVFATVFVAEIGDKTQLATMLYAARGGSRVTVFLGASLALVAAAAVGVAAGALLSGVLRGRALSVAAGAGFIGVGIWVLLKG